MNDSKEIARLKRVLRRETSTFCNSEKVWSSPVVSLLKELKKDQVDAVFFGGTLRSLMLARRETQKPGRPRDIDIVFSGKSEEDILKLLAQARVRRNSFGGIQATLRNWQFDLWALKKTWALVKDRRIDPQFDDLPSTTFLNLEAIAIEVWPQEGKPRQVFSGEEQFFRGIISRTIELNREDNPYPLLGALRAFVLASRTGYKIGPRLVDYIVSNTEGVDEEEFDHLQVRHYGTIFVPGALLRNWVSSLSMAEKARTFSVTYESQLEFPESSMQSGPAHYKLSQPYRNVLKRSSVSNDQLLLGF